MSALAVKAVQDKVTAVVFATYVIVLILVGGRTYATTWSGFSGLISDIPTEFCAYILAFN